MPLCQDYKWVPVELAGNIAVEVLVGGPFLHPISTSSCGCHGSYGSDDSNRSKINAIVELTPQPACSSKSVWGLVIDFVYPHTVNLKCFVLAVIVCKFLDHPEKAPQICKYTTWERIPIGYTQSKFATLIEFSDSGRSQWLPHSPLYSLGFKFDIWIQNVLAPFVNSPSILYSFAFNDFPAGISLVQAT